MQEGVLHAVWARIWKRLSSPGIDSKGLSVSFQAQFKQIASEEKHRFL